MRHVLERVLDRSEATEHVHLVEDQPRGLGDDFVEGIESAQVDGRRAFLLAEPDGEHLRKSALHLAVKVGVWLHAIDGEDRVRAERRAAPVKRHAG